MAALLNPVRTRRFAEEELKRTKTARAMRSATPASGARCGCQRCPQFASIRGCAPATRICGQLGKKQSRVDRRNAQTAGRSLQRRAPPPAVRRFAAFPAPRRSRGGRRGIQHGGCLDDEVSLTVSDATLIAAIPRSIVIRPWTTRGFIANRLVPAAPHRPPFRGKSKPFPHWPAVCLRLAAEQSSAEPLPDERRTFARTRCKLIVETMTTYARHAIYTTPFLSAGDAC